MNKYQKSIPTLALMAAAGLQSFLMPSAWAQANLGEQLLNGAISAASRRLHQAIPEAGPASSQPPGIAPAATAPQANQPLPPWPTKAALLEATRRGEFKGLPEIRVNPDQETAPLTNSVIRILRIEYKVPPLTGNDTMGSLTCRSSASMEIRRLLTAITDGQIQSLSDKPPTFYRETNTAARQQNLVEAIKQLGKGSGLCTTKELGVEKPHPYGLALAKLADEFSAATKDYVEAERERRKAAYEQAQARVQADQQASADAKAQRDSDARAAEQKRIATERARIEADQQRRRQIEKSRVAG
jgi:hypothetical protein